MGNTIYMKDVKSFDVLVHELTHVWQFQNGGNDYMLKAGWAQFTNWLGGNDTRVAYDWTRDIDRGWAALNAEQQAHLIQDAAPFLRSREQWTLRWAAYEAKEEAFRRKYPSTTVGGRLDGRGGLVTGGPHLDAQRLNERRALDAERASLQSEWPRFIHSGRDYTAQVEDALWRLRNRIGAP